MVGLATITLSGEVLFRGGFSQRGGGLFASGSSVQFAESSNITFQGNRAVSDGGGAFMFGPADARTGAGILFSGNAAAGRGGGCFATGGRAQVRVYGVFNRWSAAMID